MSDIDTVHAAQTIFDDAASLAKAAAFENPLIAIPVSMVKALVDLGFAAYFRNAAMAVLPVQRAAQTAGVAAAEAQAVTSALEHDRLKRICPSCIEALANHIAETTP